MPYRPDPAGFDTPLTKEEIAERRRKLAMLSEYSVRDMYREAYERCKMNGDSLPRAAAIQELRHRVEAALGVETAVSGG